MSWGRAGGGVLGGTQCSSGKGDTLGPAGFPEGPEQASGTPRASVAVPGHAVFEYLADVLCEHLPCRCGWDAVGGAGAGASWFRALKSRWAGLGGVGVLVDGPGA